jgi:hypothetical protein
VTEAEARQAFADYTDAAGLIQGQKGQSSGNALLFTAEYMLLLYIRGWLKPEDVARFQAIALSCQHEPGLYQRHPTAYVNDQEGVDDYIGIAAASCLTGLPLAQEILDYGQSHKFSWGPFKLPYYYRNERPEVDTDVRAWFGRQLSTIAHLHFAAGRKPKALHTLAWTYAVGSAGFGKQPKAEGGQDAYILSWLLIETYRAATRLNNDLTDPACDLAVELYTWRFKRAWPGGMNEVFATYFANPEHPLARCFEDGVK